MGGTGIDDQMASQLAAFVDHSREVDVKHKGERNDLVARGEALFTRADVGCATCHAGEEKTDHQLHPMLGLMVDTPTLVGIDATAPYFHDGSAPSLRVLLERSRDGSMGNTADLSEGDMDALEAYLQSL